MRDLDVSTARVDVAALTARFRSLYNEYARVFRAPGRVNLIGEHTDYNDGFVMPAAIDLACYVAAASRQDGRTVIRSLDANDEFVLEAAENAAIVGDATRRWRNYVGGVTTLLRGEGLSTGATLLISSDVPQGAGLSSSAALETSVATALLHLAGRPVDRTSVARLCQRAEHEFAGVACGIMDQYVAMHARADTALMLDCRTLEHQLVPLPQNMRLVICDSLVRHAHAAGEYNRRRAQCREAVTLLSARWPHVHSLRDVGVGDLSTARTMLNETLFRRVKHVVTENARVLATADAFERSDISAVGELLPASHASLKVDYEVSSPELDALVEAALAQPGVHGARMTGGGFGGSVIAIVDDNAVNDFRMNTSTAYTQATGRHTNIYAVTAAEGAGTVET